MSQEPESKCLNCMWCSDVSDGPEYGDPYYACEKKPHMSNLISFPFKTKQKCFELHWTFKIDWAEEARKDQEITCSRDALLSGNPDYFDQPNFFEPT